MNTIALLDALVRGSLVADGATGTQLQALGLPPGTGGEFWNLEWPERVRELHRRYRAAGAQLLTTNTFGGTAIALARHGAAERTVEINVAGARLAAESTEGEAWVLGDMGPCGGLLEPWGETSPDDARTAFAVQATALLEGGADAILVETMSDPKEAALGVEAALAAGAPLVIATFAFQKTAAGFRTMMGTTVADALAAVLAAGAGIVGANCGTELSLEDYERLAGELAAAAGGRPVIVQPNAGTPRLGSDGQLIYDGSPAQFAEAVPRLLAAGAHIIGGCCGTGPAHIAAIAAAMGRAKRN